MSPEGPSYFVLFYEVVDDFARNDPYVRASLVTRREIRPWAVAVGAD